MGQALGQQLSSANYKIHLLTRKAQQKIPYPCKVFSWPDVQTEIPPEAFPKNENYGVIHLLGEPVSQWPWSKHKKEKIYKLPIPRHKKSCGNIKETRASSSIFFICQRHWNLWRKGKSPNHRGQPHF